MKRLSLKFVTILVSVLLCGVSFFQFYSLPTAQATVSRGKWVDITPKNNSIPGKYDYYGTSNTYYSLHTPFAEIIETKPNGATQLHWFLGIPRWYETCAATHYASILHSDDKGATWNDVTPSGLHGTQMQFVVLDQTWHTNNDSTQSSWNGKLFLYANKQITPFVVGRNYNYYIPELYRYDGEGRSLNWKSLINSDAGSFEGRHTTGSSTYNRYHYYGAGFKSFITFHNGQLFLISWRNNMPWAHDATYYFHDWQFVVHAFNGSTNQLMTSNSPLTFTQKYESPHYYNYDYYTGGAIAHFTSHGGHLFIGTSRILMYSYSSLYSDTYNQFYQSDENGENFVNYVASRHTLPLGRVRSARSPTTGTNTTFQIALPHIRYTTSGSNLIPPVGPIVTAHTDANTSYMLGMNTSPSSSYDYTANVIGGSGASIWNSYFLNRECRIWYTEIDANNIQVHQIWVNTGTGSPGLLSQTTGSGYPIPLSLESFKGHLYAGFANNTTSVQGGVTQGLGNLRRTNRLTDKNGFPSTFSNSSKRTFAEPVYKRFQKAPISAWNNTTFQIRIPTGGPVYTATTTSATEYWYNRSNYNTTFRNAENVSSWFSIFVSKNCEIEYTVTGPGQVTIQSIERTDGVEFYAFGAWDGCGVIEDPAYRVVQGSINNRATTYYNFWSNSSSARNIPVLKKKTVPAPGGGQMDDRLYIGVNAAYSPSMYNPVALFSTDGTLDISKTNMGKPTSSRSTSNMSPTLPYPNNYARTWFPIMMPGGTTYTAYTNENTEYWYCGHNYSANYRSGTYNWSTWYQNQDCVIEYTTVMPPTVPSSFYPLQQGNNCIYITKISNTLHRVTSTYNPIAPYGPYPWYYDNGTFQVVLNDWVGGTQNYTAVTAYCDMNTQYWYNGYNYSGYVKYSYSYFSSYFTNQRCEMDYDVTGPNTIYVKTIRRHASQNDHASTPLTYRLDEDVWQYDDAGLKNFDGSTYEKAMYAPFNISFSSLGMVYAFSFPAYSSVPAAEGHGYRSFRIFNAQPSLKIHSEPNPLIIERGQSAPLDFVLTPIDGFGSTSGVRMRITVPDASGIFLPNADPNDHNKWFSQKANQWGPLYYLNTPVDYLSPTFRTTLAQPLGMFDALLEVMDVASGLIVSYNFKITVKPPLPGFSSSVEPSIRKFHAGEKVCFNVNINSRDEFEDNVIVGIFWNNPPPTNASQFEWLDSTYINNYLDPTTVEVFTRKNIGTQYQFCLNTEKTMTPGNWEFQLLFFSSVPTQQVKVRLQVLPPKPSFDIQTMPVIGKAVPGGVVQYQIRVSSIENYVGPVDLHVENLPNTVQLVSLIPQTVNLSLSQPVAYSQLIIQTFSSIYAPDKPSNFFSKVISSSVINLSWTPSNKGTHDIAGYEIFRGPNQYIEKATKIADVGPNVVNYDDVQGIERGTTYVYFIRSYDNQLPPNYSEFVASNEAKPMQSPVITANAVANTGTLPGFYRFQVVGFGVGTDELGQSYNITIPEDTDLLVYKQIDQMKTPAFDTWGLLALMLGLLVFMFVQKRKREAFESH